MSHIGFLRRCGGEAGELNALGNVLQKEHVAKSGVKRSRLKQIERRNRCPWTFKSGRDLSCRV
eukprot:5064078-Pleurochrysis_carterae.AAC.1